MNKYRFLCILVLLLGYFNISFGSNPIEYDSSSAIIRFTENRGQWEGNVLFRANIDGGVLFAEKDKITFLLKENVAVQHGDGDITCNNPHCKHHSHSRDDNDSLKKPSIINNLHAYSMNFGNINPEVKVSGLDAFSDYINYFKGSNKNKWFAGIKNYKSLLYEEMYSNIDFHLYSFDKVIKYDFIVKRGGNVNDIVINYNGVEDIFLNDGNLVLRTSVGDVTEFKPIAFEIENGEKIPVECSFVLKGKQLRYKVRRHNRNNVLIIDPMLVASTFSGSLSDNFGFTATYDHKGNIYSAGIDFYTGYPVSTGAFQTVFRGGDCDIAIIKYDSVGSKRLFATYLGGNGVDVPHSLIVDSKNDLLVLGTTGSDDYPVSADAYDNTFNGGIPIIVDHVLDYNKGSDIVITKLSEDGSQLLNSTYLGGTDNDGLNYDSVVFQNSVTQYYVLTKDTFFYRYHDPSLFSEKGILRDNYADEIRGALILDDNDNIFIATSTHSSDFPITNNAFQKTFGGGMQDACVFKLDNTLNTLIWSSYMGGSGNDGGYGIAINSKNQPIITGGTTSQDLPTSSKAIYPNYQGGKSDGYVAIISEDGSELLYSTYYGSYEQDQSFLVDVNRQDEVYIFGQTRAKGSELIHNALYNKPASGQFVAKLNSRLDSVIWSTAFGSGSGVPDISPTAMLVDYCNMVYLVGWGGQVNYSMGGTGTKNLEVTPNAFQTTTDGSDFYLMVLADDASQLRYATFFGGYGIGEHVDGGTSRFDKRGKVYQAVCGGCGGRSKDTSSVSKNNVMPTTEDAWSRTNNSNNCNNAVFVFSFEMPTCVADFELPPPGCVPYDAKFKNVSFTASTSPVTYLWDFGDGTTSSLKDPAHLYSKAGTYKVKLIVTDTSSCNFQDSIFKTFTVLGNFALGESDTLDDKYICIGEMVQIGLKPMPDKGISYIWTPSTGLSNAFISNPYANPANTTTYSLIITDGICTTRYTQRVIVETIFLGNIPSQSICKGLSVNIKANSSGTATGFVWSSFPDFADTLNISPIDSTLNISPTETITYFVKAYNNACWSTNSTKVTVFEVKLETQDTAICYGNSVVIKAINLIPTDNLSYKWSPTTSIIANSTKYNPTVKPSVTTTYYVTATNQLGCTQLDSIVVKVNNINLVENIKDITCAGWCDGVIDITASNGSTPYTYSWYNVLGNSKTISNLCVGTYIVKVTDKIGCYAIDSMQIKNVDTFDIKVQTTDNICYYDKKGTAKVEPSGGEMPYSFKWDNGKTEPYIDGLPAGEFEVSISDKRGCKIIEKVEIKCLSNLALSLSKEDVLCANAKTGKINTIVSGGTTPYTYKWSNGETTPNIENKDVGIYSVTVTDAESCYLNAQDTIKQPNEIYIGFGKKDITCFGLTDAYIKANVSGGIEPYKYLWSDGQTSDSIFNLSKGIYSLIITDKNNCVVSKSIEIIEPAELQVKLEQTDVMCWGDSTGEINAIVQGGTSPYKYAWSDISLKQEAVIKNLKIGIYELTVTDKNNCLVSNKTEIKQNDPIAINITTKNISCYGLYDGQLFAEANGGSPPYTYLWSNGYTKPIISNLSAGKYSLSVRDIYNCLAVQHTEIIAPEDIEITSTVKQPKCFGDANGEIKLLTTGGIAPYKYIWNNGLEGIHISNLASGNYYVTISDQNECKKILNIKLTDAPILNLNLTPLHPNCYGENTGKAAAIVSGGEKPYTYKWNDTNSQTNSIAVNLYAGEYIVTVLDNRECEVIRNVKLTQPDSITAVLKEIRHNGCNNACVGKISFSARGGTKPYSYKWSNKQEDTVITNLCKGLYALTITDKNNCVYTTEYTIIDTTLFAVNETIKGNTCFGKCDASVSIDVKAYTHPLQIKWSNGLYGSNLNYLCAGQYSVTVTDGAGCYQEKTFNIISPPEVKVNIQKLKDISCFGNCDGIALAIALGGTPPFNYQWSNNANIDTAKNLCKGVYNVSITDVNDCKAYNTISLADPIDLNIELNVNHTICKEVCNGRISVKVWGGVPPYKYLWNVKGKIIEDSVLTDLCIGTYSLSVYDSRDCYVSQTVQIDIDYSKYERVSISKSADSIFVGQSVTLTADNIINYKLDWKDENKMFLGDGVSITVSPIKQSTYYLNAIDSFGCVFPDTATIYIRDVYCDEPYIYIPNAFTPNNDNQNDKVFVRSAIIQKIYFAIFDRWGEKVFETTDMNQGWDGTYKGHALKPAVFDYYLEVTCWGNETFFKKGNITLMR